MAVTIRADVPGKLRSAAGQVVMLHVTAADPGRATEAVRAALPEIGGLAPADAPAVLMGPFRLPDGCLLLADFEAVTPPEARARIPGILARHLEQDGITEAEIGTASQAGPRYDVPGSFTPVARPGWRAPGSSGAAGSSRCSRWLSSMPGRGGWAAGWPRALSCTPSWPAWTSR